MNFTTVALYIKDLMATVMILLMMLSPAFTGDGTAYQAEKPDELITSFAVASDIHVETNNPKSYQNLSDVLYGIKAGEDVDTVVYTGDNVMNGQILEDVFFYTAIRSMMGSKNNLVTTGNHDLGNTEGDYFKLRDKFIFNNKFFLGNKIEKEYYYKVIDGCYMIVLSSEDETSWEFILSEEQLTWFENVLKEAKAADAPIFVFNHFPIRYYKDPVDNMRLANLLNAYDVDLYVHGHIHDHLGADNFYKSYGIDSINLPRITETTDYAPGDGIVVEVYEDEFVVKGRNFVDGQWIDGLRYTYSLG